MAYIGNNPKWNSGTFTPLDTVPSNPAEGMVYYDDGTNRAEGLYVYKNSVWQAVGAESASGINYIENSTGESGVTNYNTYVDAAGSVPVDGTGGTANITFAVNTTTPLRGTSDFKFTKDAANRQGEGVSYDFTIDKADLSSVLRIEFDYDASDADYDDDDMIVYIYDKDAGALIEPVGINIKAGKGKHVAYFQTHATSNDYRLILHVASTNAAAYDVFLDNIKVGPATRTYSTPATNYSEAFTLTVSDSTGMAIRNGHWARISDSLHFKGFIQMNGGGAGSTLTVALPNGFTADDSKITWDAGISSISVGIWYDISLSVDHLPISVTLDATGKLLSFRRTETSSAAIAGTDLASGDIISFHVEIPILGWGSQVQMSDEADTREIYVTGAGNGGTTITSATTALDFTETGDSHGAWDGSTFTAPTTGTYDVSGGALFTTGKSRWLSFYKDTGGGYAFLQSAATPSSSTDQHQFSGKVRLNAGDKLQVRANFSAGPDTLNNTATFHHILIQKLQAPTAIAANELVAARCSTNAGNTVSAGSFGIVDFEDTTFDSHGSVTTGSSWKFTAPASGTYNVSSSLLITTTQTAVGEAIQFYLYKNGSAYAELYFLRFQYAETAARSWGLAGSTLVQLNKGDYIDIRVNEGTTGSCTLASSNEFNHISIHRVGF